MENTLDDTKNEDVTLVSDGSVMFLNGFGLVWDVFGMVPGWLNRSGIVLGFN